MSQKVSHRMSMMMKSQTMMDLMKRSLASFQMNWKNTVSSQKIALEMLAENLSVEELIQVGKELYGPNETPDLSERDVFSVQQFAGGEEQYNQIISWAGET